MKNLLKKTCIATGVLLVIYLILFFLIDKEVVLWVHNNCPEWCFQLGKSLNLSIIKSQNI